jgi:hypothetical protein
VATYFGSPPDFHNDTHIHIPYTGSPQFNTISILATDFHPIGRIQIISKDLTTSPFHPIENIENTEGFT